MRIGRMVSGDITYLSVFKNMIFLITTEIPCKKSRNAVTGITLLRGYMGMAKPAECFFSNNSHDSRAYS
jgi:hypothetical protein